jgi:hypothetical protein
MFFQEFHHHPIAPQPQNWQGLTLLQALSPMQELEGKATPRAKGKFSSFELSRNYGRIYQVY